MCRESLCDSVESSRSTSGSNASGTTTTKKQPRSRPPPYTKRAITYNTVSMYSRHTEQAKHVSARRRRGRLACFENATQQQRRRRRRRRRRAAASSSSSSSSCFSSSSNNSCHQGVQLNPMFCVLAHLLVASSLKWLDGGYGGY